MPIFFTLPQNIDVQNYASIALVDPGSFRADKKDQPAALYVAVGNGLSDTQGSSTCDIFRIDLFSKQINKITKTSLPFGLVSGLSYDPLQDELLLIDGNLSNSDRVQRINYRTGKIKGYTFFNYGSSSVVESGSKFRFPRESGLAILHSNPSRPLNNINFFDSSELLFEKRNLFYYSYYLEGSQFYQLGSHNDYSFLISSQTPGSPSILTFKNIKSNLITYGTASSMSSDLLDDKFIYRALGNKVFTLDRVSLRTQDQTLIDGPSILGLVIQRNIFYTIHAGSNKIIQTQQNLANKLAHSGAYVENPRVKPNSKTNIFAEVTDSKYNPLNDITITANILEDRQPDFISTSSEGSSDGTLILQLIPSDLIIRDSFTTGVDNLQFDQANFSLIANPSDDTISTNFTDKMISMEIIDIPDQDIVSPIVIENFFSAELTGTIFDSTNRSLSYWTPKFIGDFLIVNFSSPQSVQLIDLVITKTDASDLIIKDQNDKIIYSNSNILGVLNSLRILDFINTPSIDTTELKIFASSGVKIYDINVKTGLSISTLGKLSSSTGLSNKGLSEFSYVSLGPEGKELIKVSSQNKVLSALQTTTQLDDTVVLSNLVNIDVAAKETAASITIGLKNPQTSFSYSTMKLVEPPPPRPVDALGGVIDYPDIPVLGNSNIIDSGSYITSITTSNNLIWVLSQGGNASIISTNPLADKLDFIVSPNQQSLGAKNVSITITARQNFAFTSGAQIDFGPGIVINSIKILEDNQGLKNKAIVNITISDVTTIGPRTIQITSGSNKVAPLNNRFEVLPQTIPAVSSINFIAESTVLPRFQSIFINSAKLTSSLTQGPFIFIVDDKGYLTRSDSSLKVEKEKIITGNIVGIKQTVDGSLIIGTEQGSFYKLVGVQDPLSFKPTLTYINSIPKILVDFEIKDTKIIAINKGIKKLDIIDINTLDRITNSHQISTQNLNRIWIKEDRLFTSDLDGVLYELDFTDFSTIKTISTFGTDIISGVEIINGFIYIATEQGKVYLYDTQLSLFQDISQEGGIVTMSKYFNTLQVGTEYGRYISILVK
jgi:hypothetical protein